MAKQVLNLLKIDNQVRNSNEQSSNNKNLVNLEQINFNIDWNYSLPTIYYEQNIDIRNKRVKSILSFASLFTKKYTNYFSQVNFDNILIAGGAVTGLLLQQTWDSDVDIFVYGLTAEEADMRIVKLIKEIYESYKEHVKKNYINEQAKNGNSEKISDEELNVIIVDKINVVNIRNKYCVTLTLDSQKIQIILRIYESISQILHGFDIGACAIGYDGKNVYFTELSKFSYENLSIIIDPSRRSTTYEKRLIKYYNRGFHIILPYLDIKKLRKDYFKYDLYEVAELPYFSFSYSNIIENKIKLHAFLKNPKYSKCQSSDYQNDDLNEYQVFYINLKNLINDKTDYYYYSTNMNLDILNEAPYISTRRIIDYYDNLLEKIHKENITIKVFKTYFSKELLVDILDDIFIKKDYEDVTKLIRVQRNKILEKYQQLACENFELKWLITNPDTQKQLTSSFNPIISDPVDWYGQYFTETPQIIEITNGYLKKSCNVKYEFAKK